MTAEEMRKIGAELHKGSKKRWEVHPAMVENYMKALCDRMGLSHNEFYEGASSKIAWGHDMLKKIKGRQQITIGDHLYIFDIPDEKRPIMRDLAVKMLMNILPKFSISRSDTMLMMNEIMTVGDHHGLNAASWLYSQGETGTEVLVPIMMHSCMVPSVYIRLPLWLQELCEITVLADKCSKNILKAYAYGEEVPVLLAQCLFGKNNTEFNYSTALLYAVIIQQGKNPNDVEKASTQMFKQRCEDLGLPVPKKCKIDVAFKNPITIPESERAKMKEDLRREYGDLYNQKGSDPNSSSESSKESDRFTQKDVSCQSRVPETSDTDSDIPQ